MKTTYFTGAPGQGLSRVTVETQDKKMGETYGRANADERTQRRIVKAQAVNDGRTQKAVETAKRTAARELRAAKYRAIHGR